MLALSPLDGVNNDDPRSMGVTRTRYPSTVSLVGCHCTTAEYASTVEIETPETTLTGGPAGSVKEIEVATPNSTDVFGVMITTYVVFAVKFGIVYRTRPWLLCTRTNVLKFGSRTHIRCVVAEIGLETTE